MKTISVTMDEPLLGQLDDAARTTGKTRSELLSLVLREWLDRAGYENHPVRTDEFEALIAAQAAALQEPPESGRRGQLVRRS